MRTYFTCLLSAVLLVATISTPVAAQSNSEASTLEKVKAKVAKLGVGEKAKATVNIEDRRRKGIYRAGRQ